MRHSINCASTVFTIFALLLSVSAPQANDKNDPAYMLMIISSPKFSDRETVETRFRFILPKFVENCSDVNRDMKAADMLVVVHNEIKKAGLVKQEGLLETANILFQVTSRISIGARNAGAPMRCSEIWAMYTSLRLQGFSIDDAAEGVTDLALTLYGL